MPLNFPQHDGSCSCICAVMLMHKQTQSCMGGAPHGGCSRCPGCTCERGGRGPSMKAVQLLQAQPCSRGSV